MPVDFEDLIADPEGGLRKLCSFLEVEFEKSMQLNRPATAVSVTAAAHDSAKAFSTESMLKGGVDQKRRDAWKTELSLIERVRCRFYFKRYHIDVLKRYGL
jgi:hypothetical protein